LPTFQARYINVTSVEYAKGSIAAKEPWRLDIVNHAMDESRELEPLAHLNLVKLKVRDGQVKMKPSVAKKV
jgi:hypothetical protein